MNSYWQSDDYELSWLYNKDADEWEQDYPDEDVRTYCGKHATEMRNCGYDLKRTSKQWKEECLKCHRHGFEYIQAESGVGGRM